MDNMHEKMISMNVITDKIFQDIINVYDSNESEDDVDEVLSTVVQFFYTKEKRKKVVRIKGYVENVVPRFTSRQFKEHFRLAPDCFTLLEKKLSLMLLKSTNIGRPSVPPRTLLLSTLWLLATPDSYRSVGLKFNLAKSSLNRGVRHVIRALCSISKDVIKWPHITEMNATTEKYKKIAGLPYVLGAIDGTHIEIPAPSIDAQCYLTRKCRYAITLQAICNADLRFTNCYAGYPGSVGDVRVFRNSDFYQSVNTNPRLFFPNEEIIIGDKAYPLFRWCLTAYRDNGHLTQVQNNFNHVLSETRQTIERAFALLKGRFRRLKYLDMSRTDLIAQTILACCVLHNICLNCIDGDIENYIVEGSEVREQNHENVEENEEIENCNDEGTARRNYLALLLHRRRGD